MRLRRPGDRNPEGARHAANTTAAVAVFSQVTPSGATCANSSTEGRPEVMKYRTDEEEDVLRNTPRRSQARVSLRRRWSDAHALLALRHMK